MQKWESIMKILDVLINDVVDNYEHKAGLVMLEDMRDKIDEVIRERSNI
jgi:hypothetical protein